MALNARKTATDIVYNSVKNSLPLSAEIDRCRREGGFDDADMRLVSELAGGTVRNLKFIDWAIANASDIKINKISPYVLAVLRVGAYQLLFTDKIPVSAAVNESVKIAKKSGNFRLAGFVNAVLRKAAQNGADIELPQDKTQRLSVKYSCPVWIVKRWEKMFGENTERLLISMNEKPDTVLRANLLRTTAACLSANLNSEGWECAPTEGIFGGETCLVSARKTAGIEKSSAYRDGMFYVQDSAASFASQALNPAPGAFVIDMCAAPGGKSTHMAEIMKNSGTIAAFDIYDQKIDRINQNAKRLGIDIIRAQKADSAVHMPEFDGSADFVLCDVPCSGLGIIRRKPDIKYIRKESDIAKLCKISAQILDNGARYLKNGGKMVFSTCTLTYEENEEQLFNFLKRHKDFKLKKIDCSAENEGYITLTPFENKCDGFFIALLEKEMQ